MASRRGRTPTDEPVSVEANRVEVDACHAKTALV
jgi:hypothetical protein